ncbi:MAG TPA: molybdopterin-dependent oxidoreductase [Rhodothermales bacterium]|nr:molybdopterin-dependent oxidoreductase [Rhodothermales bacterium]
MLVHTAEPFNAEEAPERLVEAFVTPAPAFFARNHGPAPDVDPAAFRLTVDGLVKKPLSLSLSDLARFPRFEVPATLQCAGNRRQDLIAFAPTPGEVPWRDGALGTAVWGGVRLADVLAEAGVEDGAKHVAFLSLDEVERHGERFPFGGSVPLAKALAPEVLLADTMDGGPLPHAHGGPLRGLVPGFIGARSVKWVARITVQAEESANYFQRHAYKVIPPEVAPPGADASGVDWDALPAIEDFPVSAVIAAPTEGARLAAGPVAVRGYALTGGGRALQSVEVSADGGATWTAAAFLDAGTPWTWRRWEAVLPLAPGVHALVARARDEQGGQPPDVADVWNVKGYLNNAWHRVHVEAG